MKLYAGEPSNDTVTKSSKRELHLNERSKVLIDIEGADELSATDLDENPMCLVLGSEGQGLSQEVKAVCSPISIPMPGRFESLNVAVAGGILLYLLQKKKEHFAHH
jgi:tRNA G18 (ribose-2'-O)-methylase SpoU